MKIFRLNRIEDVHGRTGTGVVATGVIFNSGKVVMTWRTDKASITVFDSITVVEELHSHNGRTIIEYLPVSKAQQKKIEDFICGGVRETDIE